MAPGPHRLVVKRGQEELFTEVFTLKSGGEKVIQASWQPKGQAPKPQVAPAVAPRLTVVPITATRALEGHRDAVGSVTFSADGRRAVSGGGRFVEATKGKGSDYAIRIWDVETAAELARLEGHQDIIRMALFVPGKDQVISGGRDHNLILWDVGSRRIVSRTHTRFRIWGLALSPDGRGAFTATGGLNAEDGPEIWEVPSLKRLKLRDAVRPLPFGGLVAHGQTDPGGRGSAGPPLPVGRGNR